jgi:mono/diheme cytochrome c family protein
MRNLRLVLVSGAVGALAFLAAPRPAQATINMQKEAKAAGLTEITGCISCHNEKLPKKGAATQNERGKWLQAEKDKRKADKIDVTWLKDYKPAETK